MFVLLDTLCVIFGISFTHQKRPTCTRIFSAVSSAFFPALFFHPYIQDNLLSHCHITLRLKRSVHCHKLCVQCRQSCPELCCDQKNILVPISLCCRWTISTCFHARHTHFSLHHELVPQAHKTGSSVAFQSYRNCRVNWVIVGRISHHYKLSLKI